MSSCVNLRIEHRMAEITEAMVLQYVVKKCYPDGIENIKNGKRRLRSKASKFSFENGQLLYTVKAKLEDGRKRRHQSKRHVLLNKDEQVLRMTELHASLTGGGHLGREKTLHKVSSSQ